MPFLDDEALDGVGAIVDNGTRVSYCSAQPANFAGIAAVSLGEAAIGPADFSVGDGASSGRKVELAGQSFVATSTGNVTHGVIDDGTKIVAIADATAPFAVVDTQAYNAGIIRVTVPDPS